MRIKIITISWRNIETRVDSVMETIFNFPLLLLQEQFRQ